MFYYFSVECCFLLIYSTYLIILYDFFCCCAFLLFGTFYITALFTPLSVPHPRLAFRTATGTLVFLHVSTRADSLFSTSYTCGKWFPRGLQVMCLAPPPGQVAPGLGARSPGIVGQDAQGKRRGGHNGYDAVESLEFHSELYYILYLPAVTKSRISGNSGSDSGSGVR